MSKQFFARVPAAVAVCSLALWAGTAGAQELTLADADDAVAKAVPVAEAAATPTIERRAEGDTSVAPLVATVQLNVGDTQLRGMLLSATELSVKTAFGDVSVPLSEVAGIKLASESNPTTTIVLHNGDSITGGCDLSRVQLQTEWGLADIEGTAINSIVFAEGLNWVLQDARGGSRWELLAKPVAGAQKYKTGDTIVATQDGELKYGQRVVGMVRKNEMFNVENVDGNFVFVRTRGNMAGWLDISLVQPQQQQPQAQR